MPPERSADPQPRIIELRVTPNAAGELVIQTSQHVRVISEKLLGGTDGPATLAPSASRLLHIEGRWEGSQLLVAVSVTVRREVDQILLVEAFGQDGQLLDLNAYRPPQHAIGTAPTSSLGTRPEQSLGKKKPQESPPLDPKTRTTDVALVVFLGTQMREGDEGVGQFIARMFEILKVSGWNPAQPVDHQLHLLNTLAGQGKVLSLLRGLAFMQPQDIVQTSYRDYALVLLRRLRSQEGKAQEWAQAMIEDLKGQRPELFIHKNDRLTGVSAGKALPSLTTLVDRIVKGSMSQIEFNLPTLGAIVAQPTIGTNDISEHDLSALALVEAALAQASQSHQNRQGADRGLMNRLQEAARRQKLSLGELHASVKSKREDLIRRAARSRENSA